MFIGLNIYHYVTVKSIGYLLGIYTIGTINNLIKTMVQISFKDSGQHLMNTEFTCNLYKNIITLNRLLISFNKLNFT